MMPKQKKFHPKGPNSIKWLSLDTRLTSGHAVRWGGGGGGGGGVAGLIDSMTKLLFATSH